MGGESSGTAAAVVLAATNVVVTVELIVCVTGHAVTHFQIPEFPHFSFDRKSRVDLLSALTKNSASRMDRYANFYTS